MKIASRKKKKKKEKSVERDEGKGFPPLIANTHKLDLIILLSAFNFKELIVGLES